MRHNVSFMLLHHWYPDFLCSCHLILHQGRFWYQRKMGINYFFLVHLQFLRLITLRQFIFNLKQDIRALFPSYFNPFYAGFGTEILMTSAILRVRLLLTVVLTPDCIAHFMLLLMACFHQCPRLTRRILVRGITGNCCLLYQYMKVSATISA
ncbi:uncharacterized protein LOC115980632 isoform X2 [Quercus lobata]|uniref:uncharacterized protein LOC115980632 isoform X2 n=1 Tax=Quercus lobata TaxID=97700 RepID=UPI001247EC33|nr:uncharacterized protein LOC115980632 isoform X2 [Quercus lobata]